MERLPTGTPSYLNVAGIMGSTHTTSEAAQDTAIGKKMGEEERRKTEEKMVVPAQPLYMAPAPPQMAPTPFGVIPAMAPPMKEPPSKRARGEDNLMPEADFLARNVSPVTFRILVPSASDKPEWKLNGQMLAVTLPLSDPISAMKAKIHEETGMPPGKQKLQMENIFFKDSNTLAFYNIYPNTVVHLQIKERGGRKK